MLGCKIVQLKIGQGNSNQGTVNTNFTSLFLWHLEVINLPFSVKYFLSPSIICPYIPYLRQILSPSEGAGRSGSAFWVPEQPISSCRNSLKPGLWSCFNFWVPLGEWIFPPIEQISPLSFWTKAIALWLDAAGCLSPKSPIVPGVPVATREKA